MELYIAPTGKEAVILRDNDAFEPILPVVEVKGTSDYLFSLPDTDSQPTESPYLRR